MGKMITIKNKEIIFQNDYVEGVQPLPIVKKPLISGFVCPKCKRVILAYFKTDEYIPVWAYDGKSEKECDYKIFHVNGFMGIEVKEHIQTTYTSSGYYGRNEEKSCDFVFYETYNLVEAVNSIFGTIEEKINEHVYNDDKMFRFKKMETANKGIIHYLKDLECITVIKNRCNSEVLISFDLSKFEYPKIESVDEDKFKYGSPKYKQAERENKKIDTKNKNARLKAYKKFVKDLIKISKEV